MKYKNTICTSNWLSNMKKKDAEYAEVKIIIQSPSSELPPKIQQSKIEEVKAKKAELKKAELKEQGENIQEDRARRQRQDNIGLSVVIAFMVSTAFNYGKLKPVIVLQKL